MCICICICTGWFLTWNLNINIGHLFQALYRWSALCSRAIEACIRAIFETITIAAFWPPNFNASICRQHFRVSPNWNNLAMDICWIGEQRTLENCDDTPQDYSKQIQNKQGCWMEETSKTFLCLQTTWKCNLLIFLAQYLCELKKKTWFWFELLFSVRWQSDDSNTHCANLVRSNRASGLDHFQHWLHS